ncbi:MAG: 50S ribosomal protein L21 [Thioalkalivibrionaceae bacterium]
MYAIIATGGKQYRVSEGDLVRVELIDGEIGSEVSFDDVRLVGGGESVTVGTPRVEGARVSGSIEAQGRGEKIRIIKFRRRKHHMKRMGHRQYFTAIRITGISA